ncbi:MAG: hypothetical protein WD645_01485, partial [Dehalococcoidia bacterium]
VVLKDELAGIRTGRATPPQAFESFGSGKPQGIINTFAATRRNPASFVTACAGREDDTDL